MEFRTITSWTTIVIMLAICIMNGCCQSQEVQNLDELLQSLSPEFLDEFLSTYFNYDQEADIYKVNQRLSSKDQGELLYFLAKCHLYQFQLEQLYQKTGAEDFDYQTISKGKYLLAYFYLSMAAKQKGFPQAQYMLAILQFYRLIPDEIVAHSLNIELKSNRLKLNELQLDNLDQIIKQLKSSHLSEVENTLYSSSLMGNKGATSILASLNKRGLGMERNCSASLGYYLSLVRQQFVDAFQFQQTLEDKENFQKPLYLKQRLAGSYSQIEELSIIHQSKFFDEQTINANLQMAYNYYFGRNGYRRNYSKAIQIFAKLAEHNDKQSKAVLGVCYLKGHGVQKNIVKARQLFEESTPFFLSNYMLISMKYYGIGEVQDKKGAIEALEKQEPRSSLFKFLKGVLLLKGQIKNKNQDEKKGVQYLQQASLAGNSMSTVILGLLFVDGIQISYECWRAIQYFSQWAKMRPFFSDKYQMAKSAMKKGFYSFAFFKYLELTMVADENSNINALYALQVYEEEALKLNADGFNLKDSKDNHFYRIMKDLKYVSDLQGYLLAYYRSLHIPESRDSKIIRKIFTPKKLQDYLTGNQQIMLNEQQKDVAQLVNMKIHDVYLQFIKFKLVKIGSSTNSNSLFQFYQYKNIIKKQPQKMYANKTIEILKTVAQSSETNKLHVMEAKYLLGKHYQIQYQEMLPQVTKRLEQIRQQKQSILKKVTNQQGQQIEHDPYLSAQLSQLQNLEGNFIQLLQQKQKSALTQYKLALKSQYLAKVIYFIEGGDFQLTFLEQIYAYVLIIMVIATILYIQKSRKQNEFFTEQLNRMKEKDTKIQEESQIKIDQSAGQMKQQSTDLNNEINSEPIIQQQNDEGYSKNLIQNAEPLNYGQDDTQPLIQEQSETRKQKTQ